MSKTVRVGIIGSQFVSSFLSIVVATALGRGEADELATRSFVYKKTKQADLQLTVHYPSGWTDSDKRPAIVFFFGGGWTQGKIEQFKPQTEHLAGRGMVAIRADYRVKSRHGVTPKECVEDAESAVRMGACECRAAWRGPGPNRGRCGSAGGHLAACTALTPGLEAAGEDLRVSSQPTALVLFNPVLQFTGEPQLMGLIGKDRTLGEALSPTLHLAKDSPPALLFFGTADRLAVMGDEFVKKSKELGHRAELFTAEGQSHGFFNEPPWLDRTTQRMDEFLVSLNYLAPKDNGAGLPTRQERDAPFVVEVKKPEDRIELTRERDTAIWVVISQTGIGRATITSPNGDWPTHVKLQLRLSGLEHFAVSNGKTKLTGSVQSHSGNPSRLRVADSDSSEERVLQASISAFDSDGNSVGGLPGKGGYFEIVLPQVLFASRPRQLELEWIDFYRG